MPMLHDGGLAPPDLGVQAVRCAHNKLHITISANERSVRHGLHAVKSGLGHLNLAVDDWSTIELVLAEVLNNIVKHAYRQGDDNVIRAQLDHSGPALACTILDSGRPMPNGVLPLGQPKDLDCDVADLPEGGFGWLLIRQLTQDLQYHREMNQNTLTFNLPVGSEA